MSSMTGVAAEPGMAPGRIPQTLRNRTSKLQRSSNVASFWFLLPIAVVFTVLTVIPLLNSAWWSFTNFNPFTQESSFVGLANYRTVLTDPTLLRGLGFTLMYAIGITICVTILAIALALALNAKFPGRNFARAVFFFLGIPSIAILGLVWRYIFSPMPSGVLNTFLRSVGLENQPWLADAGMARFAVIFVGVWAGVGWHATLYLAYLQAIPGDLYEQAVIDGANARQRFAHITLPLLTPGIAVSSFLLMTGGLQVYALPVALTAHGPGDATLTVTHSIIMRGITQSDFGVSSALAVLFTFAVLIVVLLQVAVTNAVSKRYSA